MEFEQTLKTYEASTNRALNLCALHQHLTDSTTDVLNADDMLRSAITLVVSAFDYLMHELIRIEYHHRVQNKLKIDNFEVPISLLALADSSQYQALDSHIRHKNGYKSFIAPDKVAQALKSFLPNPWDNISSELNLNTTLSKQRLKAIANWRNRIAHEADIHPDFGGTQLWPINHDDVVDSILFMKELGISISKTMINHR